MKGETLSMKSLLAYLAHNFTTQTENLATEALTYLLINSLSAKNAVYKINKYIDNTITP